MTRDEIIAMALEADDFADSYTPQYVTLPNEWHEIRDARFAALVAAAEREACAQVAEKMLRFYTQAVTGVPEAIRARGEK